MPCASTTQATDMATDHSGLSCASKLKPMICVTSPTVSMRVMP